MSPSEISRESDTICLSDHAGKSSRIESYVHIAPDAIMGRDCFLGARTMIDSGVCIGDRVVLEGGSHLFSGVIIEDDVSIGTNTTFARTRERDQATPTLVSSIILRHHCSIGANATLSSGITIGEYALVHAGAVVMHSVQPHAIVSGNPAEVIGFANTVASIAGAPPSTSSDQPPIVKSKVQGVASYQLPLITDPRGNLIVGEFERTLPFIPKRYFMTFDVPNTKLRGEHAHKNCEQFLICIRGSCAVVVDDGIQREEFQLNQPTFGIHLPAMIWSTEYKHSADSLLMAFASDYYDPDDYIRDYQTFLSAKKESLA